jgi:hypothetical protein
VVVVPPVTPPVTNPGAPPTPPPPPPVVTPPAPTAPSAGVAALRARLDVNVVRLTWRAPRGAAVVVVRRIGRRPLHPADGVVVYRGARRVGLDTVQATRRVWYAVFLAGSSTSSTSVKVVYASLPRVLPRLLAPLQGARTGRTVRFAWRPVAGARYYNVQIWNGAVTRRIVTRWPIGRTLTVRLDPGRYRWYVYPGYGRPATARYGKLIGQGSFRVR